MKSKMGCWGQAAHCKAIGLAWLALSTAKRTQASTHTHTRATQTRDKTNEKQKHATRRTKGQAPAPHHKANSMATRTSKPIRWRPSPQSQYDGSPHHKANKMARGLKTNIPANKQTRLGGLGPQGLPIGTLGAEWKALGRTPQRHQLGEPAD